ncbi:MAG: PIN domain nuclease [Algoriphagus sp.]|uniref:type II toxin-antitoxin system VapC family toxin n=1 Tax=Algoriphagus sp. TaxID=1872435 RepID=UPI00262225FF|nr:PIN domain nuclease [Algoriphagus sp.]MDG1278038.1 PIN domain nuclease [Algoriphagus sp.]
MIMVDSSVWIDYFNGKATLQSDFLNRILGIEDVCIGDLIMTEVLQGFTFDQDVKVAYELFNDLLIFDLVGKEIAYESAKSYRELRKKGVTVRKTMDMIIGTFCIKKNIRLLHSDKDFDPMVTYLNLKSVF